jgi:acetyl-CoA carboxylase biotin carboxyl carrier protein
MRIEEVRRLIRLVEESNIGELEVWKWWGRVRIKKSASGQAELVTTVAESRPASVNPAPPAPVPSPPPEASPEPDAEAGLVPIQSPMVGTFYRAPAPDAEPYVQAGQSVEPGQTVCIIEAMKLMNEIQSEVRGRIQKILVDNAQPVEFGQTLFLVKEE